MKHYLITGGTGLIGSVLCRHLKQEGHHITVLSRNADKVLTQCGQEVRAITSLAQVSDEMAVDVVINLAGASIADGRWTQKRKAQLEASRVNFTQDLVSWMGGRKQKPDCFISGSAVGWYGDQGDTVLTEQSTYHDEYTHQLCEAWEREARRAEQDNIRVCIVRTGLVLASTGGVLQKMLLPFKWGLGGRLGSGDQYMPWVDIDDMINIICFLETRSLSGVFNACSPDPVINKTFTNILAKQLKRPAIFPVPSWLLKLLLGEMASLLITGQKAVPQRLNDHGFQFSYPTLVAALEKNVNRGR